MSMELVVEVLVVDDSAVDRQLAGRLLETQSHLSVGYAKDGHEALAIIEAQPPQIVVTDLQMPGMDGLELVRVLRKEQPQLPVILMTGHGSEAVAAEALRQGAVSYVSKGRLAKELVPTLEKVLERQRTEGRRERLLDCLVSCDSVYVLDNDSSLITLLVENVQQCLVRIGFCEAHEALQVGSALEAALLNALYHGNLELAADIALADWTALEMERRSKTPYRDRQIHVRIRVSADDAQFIIRDEGPGFDYATRAAAIEQSPVSEQSRGLTLMHTFMDRVIFNSIGNEVTLVKRRQPGDRRAFAEVHASAWTEAASS
jgi:CheY-like chemotaxis protein